MTTYAEREGFALVDLESTYGAGAATSTLYVEEATIDAQREILPRNGPSPYRAGYMPVVGSAKVTFSLKAEMVPTTMTDEPTERPPEDLLFRAASFIATASGAAADPDIVTYALQSNLEATNTSLAVQIHDFNSDDDDGWYRKASGCRGDFSFEITPGERWYFTVSGEGSSFANTPIGASRASEGVPSYDFSDAPVVAGAAGCLIKAVTANETYPATGRVVSFSCTGNNSPSLKRGVCGQKVSAYGDAVTATLVLEVQDAGDFDPWQYQGQVGAAVALPDAILVQIGSPDLSFDASGVAVDAGDYILFRGYFYIQSIAMGGDSNAKTWTLNLVGAYVPGTLAGEDTSEGIINFVYGTKS